MQTGASRMQQFPEDTVIIREGDRRNEMYKIISGKAAVYINYGKKNEYLLGILSEQQCFGELGILCKAPSMYTVVAVYDVLAMRICEEEFENFLQNNNKNAIDMIKNLSWSVMNLKCNLDMVLNELENESGTEKMNVHQLKEKIYQYTLSDIKKREHFNQTV